MLGPAREKAPFEKVEGYFSSSLRPQRRCARNLNSAPKKVKSHMYQRLDTVRYTAACTGAKAGGACSGVDARWPMVRR